MLILFKSALPNITLSYNASFELDSFHRPPVDHHICGIVALVAPHANFATMLRRHISSREKFKNLVPSAPDHESEGSGVERCHIYVFRAVLSSGNYPVRVRK